MAHKLPPAGSSRVPEPTSSNKASKDGTVPSQVVPSLHGTCWGARGVPSPCTAKYDGGIRVAMQKAAPVWGTVLNVQKWTGLMVLERRIYPRLCGIQLGL